MSAHAIIEKVGEERTLTSYLSSKETVWQPFTASCSECDFKFYSMAPVENLDSLDDRALGDHLAQHDPGRARDIEPYYEVHADCSVCEDGGDVRDRDDVLECNTCGTTWDRDGKNGELVNE